VELKLPAAPPLPGRHRRALLAASILLDVLNVFLFFLTIFSGGEK